MTATARQLAQSQVVSALSMHRRGIELVMDRSYKGTRKLTTCPTLP
jgi:hypothetical protein